MHKKFLAVLFVLAAFATAPASAGPPLICHPVDIASAQSLPWRDGSDWNGMLESYNTAALVHDTLALTAPATPVNVRMETLRRAAIYSSRDPRLADQIASRLFERKAWFEAGYFMEAVREAAESYSMIQDPVRRAAWHLRATPPYIASLLAQRH